MKDDIEEELITFSTAKLAKEKGFTTHCRHYYDEDDEELGYNPDFPENSWDDHIFAPTQSLLQRWLREVHNIIVIPDFCIDMYSCELYNMRNGIKGCKVTVSGVEWKDNCTYEQALEKGLFQALELIK